MQTYLQSSPRHNRPAPRAAFTLIELLVVMGIIVILVALAVPAVRTLGKSNDQSQAANVIRSLISSARSIAISQHRMAGVIFFEETSTYSRPVNVNQTAMQIIVESFNPPAGTTVFVHHSTARQYLPQGVKLATLSETAGGAAGNVEFSAARVILFDANGDLVTRSGLSSPPVPGVAFPGRYDDFSAYGDWHLDGNDTSSPGFFLYSKAEYDSQPTTPPAVRSNWLKNNANVIIVNVNTGTVFQ